MYQVYLLTSDEDSIVPKTITVSEEDRRNPKLVLDRLIEELQNPGASDSNNGAPFFPVLDESSGFASAEIIDTQVVVDFDAKYMEMDPIKAVLVRGALARTLTQISGIKTVYCTINGDNMIDSAGFVIGPMSADSFIDNAGAQINAEERTNLKLYFANETGDGLVVVNRSVVYSGNISMDKLVVEQLLAGPSEGENAYPVMNTGTKIINVTTQDGTCYVNLDESFLTPENNITNDVALYSIVDSLIELGTINKVQFMIDSNSDITFRESVNLNTLFERNLDIVVE